MSLSWRNFMSGRLQDREIQQFMDQISPQIGALRGLPANIALDTTRAVIITWPTGLEIGGFSGNVDGVAGEITIPSDGIYAVTADFNGILSGGAASGEAIIFVRSSLTGDAPVDVDAIVLGTLRVGFSFSIWNQFSEGETLSIAVDATANLGTLTFAGAYFEVIRRD